MPHTHTVWPNDLAALQGQGFAAAYLASSSPQVSIPACASGSKLLQVVLRTRGYGSELSWLVTKRSLLNVVFAPTPNEQNIVMAGEEGSSETCCSDCEDTTAARPVGIYSHLGIKATQPMTYAVETMHAGGALPPSVRSKVPPAVAATAEAEYKDYRSYYSYACLPVGSYNLFSYDSYGDGWEGGRITLTQVVNASTGCVLLSGASPTRFNLTTPFAVTVRLHGTAALMNAQRPRAGPKPFAGDNVQVCCWVR